MVKVCLDQNYNLHYDEGASMLDDVPDSLSEVLPEHWRQFPPNHPMLVDFLGVWVFFLWIINVSCNGLVLYLLVSTPSLRSPSNLLVANLAVSDLIMMTFLAPSFFVNVIFSDYWMYGPLHCKIYGCVGGLFGTLSIMTMIVIAWDRYNVIVKGWSRTPMTYPKAIFWLAFMWIYCFVSAIPPFFGWGGYTLEGLLMTCGYDYFHSDFNTMSYVFFATITHYILPMVLLIGFYGRIVHAVFAHERSLKQQAKKMNVASLRTGNKGSSMAAEIRITKVALTNVVLWFVIWTPYTVAFVFGVVGLRHWVTPLVSQLTAVLAKTACCINPIVFALGHPKIQQELKERAARRAERKAEMANRDAETKIVEA